MPHEESACCLDRQAIAEITQRNTKKYPQEPHLGVARGAESKQAHVGFSISILGTYSQDV